MRLGISFATFCDRGQDEPYGVVALTTEDGVRFYAETNKDNHDKVVAAAKSIQRDADAEELWFKPDLLEKVSTAYNKLHQIRSRGRNVWSEDVMQRLVYSCGILREMRDVLDGKRD